MCSFRFYYHLNIINSPNHRLYIVDMVVKLSIFFVFQHLYIEYLLLYSELNYQKHYF
jgi:hypothetical protein